MNLIREVFGVTLTLSLIFCNAGFGQELNAAKCMTKPNTMKKVDSAIKECSEEVKTNIIKEAFKIIHHQIAGHSQHVDDEHHVHIYHDSIPDKQNAEIYPEHQPHYDEQHVEHVYHDENDLHDEHQLSPTPYSHSLHEHDDHPSQHPNSPPVPHGSEDFSTQYQQQHHTSHQEQSGHNYIIHEQHPTPDKSAPELYVVNEQRVGRHNDANEYYPINQSQNPTSRDSYRQHPIHRHIQQHTSPHGKQHHYEHFERASRKRKRHAVDDHWQTNTISVGDKRIAGCLLHCIYSKNKAVDNLGWPTLDGLVHFYSEGVQEHGYFMTTLRAVNICLKEVSVNHHINRHRAPDQGQSCDVSFELFDCISDKIAEYCSGRK